jgi:hypothetical protein
MGDPKSAVEYVEESEQHKPLPIARVENLSVKAMAEHQLEHTEQARLALAEANKLLNQLPASQRKPLAETLLREAQGKIEGGDASQ